VWKSRVSLGKKMLRKKFKNKEHQSSESAKGKRVWAQTSENRWSKKYLAKTYFIQMPSKFECKEKLAAPPPTAGSGIAGT